MSADVRAAVVLAAGRGTRFRSERAKVLHELAGRTMLHWVLDALRPLALDRIVVVVGHQADAVRAEAAACDLAGLVTVTQAAQRGTGHAVRQAFDAGALDAVDTVLVLPGDVPLLTPGPLRALLDHHGARPATVLSTRLGDPTGYGRVLRNSADEVVGIVEERDATDAQRTVDEVGTSIYAFARDPLDEALRNLSTDNAQDEEYLTDVIGPLTADAVTASAELVAGVNDRGQLAAAARVLRGRVLAELMAGGVTVVDPAATYVDADALVAADAVLRPGTHLEGRCVVGAGAEIGPDSRLVDATVEEGATVTYSVLVESSVGPGASVGPYSYLRPGTRLERGAKTGAFVEVKKSVIGEHSKVPHLSYIGDATIGKDVNVGAATVTVNYDGSDKHATVIGDGAFIGSDTMLVAPVEVGPGAYTGAGSVITKDVPEGALAIERSQQRIIPGYAERKRNRS